MPLDFIGDVIGDLLGSAVEGVAETTSSVVESVAETVTDVTADAVTNVTADVTTKAADAVSSPDVVLTDQIAKNLAQEVGASVRSMAGETAVDVVGSVAEGVLTPHQRQESIKTDAL